MHLDDNIFILPFSSLFADEILVIFDVAPDALEDEGPGTGSLSSEIIMAWVSFPI